jgi:2-oxoglutarate ferredoxin oxidoreductase subunit alpha
MRLRAYPFSDAVEAFVRKYDRIYIVEQNRDAQMQSLMKIDLPAELATKYRSVLHYNGLPIDARSITDAIVAQEQPAAVGA